MNPSIPVARLERERRRDSQRFTREFEGEFIEDLEAFLAPAWVEEAVVAGRHELPPEIGVRYVAAVDPSGGGPDAFTFAIVHAEGTGSQARVVQDVMKGWERIGANLGSVVEEITGRVREYGCTEVIGDRYAGHWVRAAFQERGIIYRDAEVDKATAYLEIEPLFAQGRIFLLDHPRLVRELTLLERRPRPGGRTVVDHPRGGRDDFANSLALAVQAAMQGPSVARPAAGKFDPTTGRVGWPRFRRRVVAS
jgi:hypothetical protein